jgi:hypothetical protein
MADPAVSTPTIDGFLRRWEASGAAERANYSMFLNELCDLLEVTRPDPAGPDDEKNAYVFECAEPCLNRDGMRGSSGRILNGAVTDSVPGSYMFHSKPKTGRVEQS